MVSKTVATNGMPPCHLHDTWAPIFFVQLGGRRSQPTDHSIKQIVQQEHLSLSDGWMIVLLGGW